MSKQKNVGVPYQSETESEQGLWTTLSDLPQPSPSEQLRRQFYSRLEQNRYSYLQRVRKWLGFENNVGWITATACVLVGLALGRVMQETVATDDDQLLALQHQVSLLNRNLILDKLQSESPNTRLQGVISAASWVADDVEIADAILDLAAGDDVSSIRTAAIGALAPRVNQSNVSSRLMDDLAKTESPLVQFALVDLILRHGESDQVEGLLRLADAGVLHDDLSQHVKNSVQRNPI